MVCVAYVVCQQPLDALQHQRMVLCLCVHGTAGWVGDYVDAVGGLKWYTSLVFGAYEWVSGSVPCPVAYDLLAAQYCVSAPHCPASAAAACSWSSCCIVQQAMCPLAADSRVLIPLLGAVQFESRTASAMDVNSC